jgi:hypothetical protein
MDLTVVSLTTSRAIGLRRVSTQPGDQQSADWKFRCVHSIIRSSRLLHVERSSDPEDSRFACSSNCTIKLVGDKGFSPSNPSVLFFF